MGYIRRKGEGYKCVTSGEKTMYSTSAGNEGRRRMMMETCEKSMGIGEGGKDQGQGDDLPQIFISPKIFNREDNSA